MYKIASSNAQHAVSLHDWKKLVNGTETRTTEDEINDLRRIKRALDADIFQAKEQRHGRDVVKALGLKIQEIQNQISKLAQKSKTKMWGTFEAHFVEICRETMTVGQFAALKRAADDRARSAGPGSE